MAQRGPKKLPPVKCTVNGCETLTNRKTKGVYYCNHPIDFMQERGFLL